ncbi:hypothetical protein CY34DRAFT_805661 [Suillus luteus UH-Slu-Lm8-n1]|uniref:Uncharacterized protein n=1 Tax=Suillus luteus UH-Slu-Lm8-n1 TaxID=930992 RepID=A0A0C9ZVA9_9AGAM|nr:hypothetical protein CY34DRAFT_805661 [Suillus luteus UH-Slu-Lm8-n1]
MSSRAHGSAYASHRRTYHNVKPPHRYCHLSHTIHITVSHPHPHPHPHFFAHTGALGNTSAITHHPESPSLSSISLFSCLLSIL